MSEVKTFSPSAEFTKNAHINSVDQYKEMYDRSVNDPDGFWAEQAERLTWFKKWDKVSNYDLAAADIKWFEGGKLNVSYNCLDRHVENGFGDKTALICQGESFTFKQLQKLSLRLSGLLWEIGVRKGTKIAVLLGNSVDFALSILATARLGAVIVPMNPTLPTESVKCAFSSSDVEFAIMRTETLRRHKSSDELLPSGKILSFG